jgi:hypothetical protein
MNVGGKNLDSFILILKLLGFHLLITIATIFRGFWARSPKKTILIMTVILNIFGIALDIYYLVWDQ